MKTGIIAILLSLTALSAAWGQAQVSAGDLKGTVLDPGGSVISAAKITVTDPARGTSRSTQTELSGEYRVPLLPPGTYRVRVEASGFSTKIIEGVEIRVGDTVVLNANMELGAVATELTVAAQVQVVEAERTQQATTIESHRIDNLPINRRNYLDFALLAPGVVETNDLVDGTDFRVVQTPHSGLSFGGSNGRGNAFTVDGVENYVSSGGVRPSVSQQAVREFQINRNSFSAEFGGALGGAINIITKSGTNDMHGNLFGFLRHRSIQARNYFDPGKSAFTRGQYGATFSTPLKKDKTFLFAAYERLDRHETAFVPILQDRSSFSQLTPSQQQLVDFFERIPSPELQQLAQGMRDYLTTTNYPATIALFDRNSGVFPFGESTNMVSVRLDHQLSAKDTLFLRGNFTDMANENSQFGALIGFSRGRGLAGSDGAVTVSNTYIFNPRWISETRLLFDYNKLEVTPNDQFGPDISITGYGYFGREIFLPSRTIERHYQFQQYFDFSSGRHTVKFGADVNPVRVTARSETFFGGRFLFGENIPLSGFINAAIGNPNASQGIATLLTLFDEAKLVPNLLDPLSSLQAYNPGLPILYQQGFGDPNWTEWFTQYSFFMQDSFKVHPQLTLNLGARYEVQGVPSIINTDKNNIAPRFGFAWTPTKAARTVIRGGAGLYYSQVNAQIANIPATLDGKQIRQAAITPLGIPGLTNPATGQPLTSFDVYQTLAAQGVLGTRTITERDIAQFGLRPGPNAPGRVIFGVTRDYANPYSQQASLEIEQAIGQFAASAGYVFNHSLRLPRTLDRNLFYSGRTLTGQPTYGFYDPSILQYNVLESTANSSYHALILQLSRRFSNHFSFNAHYTFSKAIDESTDFNSDFSPHDQLNARAERALSSFDQRHRVVASAVMESGLRPGRDKGAAANILGGFIFSPIVIASSGRPFNLLSGYDNLGDNHPTTHRPFGAGRNIGKGPNYFTVDLRLARIIPLSEDAKRSIEITAEGFNLLNHTNFKNINNTVGKVRLEELAHPIVGIRGSPTAPLSFTSAFDARQFQFGLKINF